MRVFFRLVAISMGLLTLPAHSQTQLKFLLDWRIEGPSAPFFLALDKGFYKAENLEVSFAPGSGAGETAKRSVAEGYQLSMVDTSSLIKFRDDPKNVPLKIVMMAYDAPAFAIVTFKKSRINHPKKLEGKLLGQPVGETERMTWPIFVKANNIDEPRVGIQNVTYADREKELISGRVDAVNAFWFSSQMTLIANGVKPDDLEIFLMRDWGVELYGNAIAAHPDLIKNNPQAVEGFVRATIRGFQAAQRDPEAAIASMMKFHPSTNKDLELNRLRLALDRNIFTSWVRRNGLGGIDVKRFEKSIDQLEIAYKFNTRPKVADVFTEEFLPPKERRTLR